MAVTTDGGPVMFPITQDDPRLPLARWAATVRATGDASGGNLVATITLRTGAIWSLEDGFPACNVAVISEWTFDTGVTMTPGGDRIVYGYSIQFRATEAGNNHAIPTDHRRIPPLIFQPDLAPVISLVILNGAGRSLISRAWGYLWDQAAIKWPGGPQLPSVLYPQIDLGVGKEERAVAVPGLTVREGLPRVGLFTPYGPGPK